ncbi:MAG: 30S ribosomal protein S15 [bacterium]|nr:30S ribosomal protein S15 [bacterium]
MLTPRKKQNVIKEHQFHETDTGSSPVQIGILSKRISELAAHLKKHLKDNHSRRGLLMMVGKRKRLLDYLSKTNTKAYHKIVRDLGLKK